MKAPISLPLFLSVLQQSFQQSFILLSSPTKQKKHKWKVGEAQKLSLCSTINIYNALIRQTTDVDRRVYDAYYFLTFFCSFHKDFVISSLLCILREHTPCANNIFAHEYKRNASDDQKVSNEYKFTDKYV